MSRARSRYPTIEEYDKETMLQWLARGFIIFQDEIEALGHSVATFASLFYYDYLEARPIWTEEDLFVACFGRVYLKNKKKYAMYLEAYSAEYDPIENYNRHEESTRTRTPDLTQKTEAESERKQTRTTTETPNNWKEKDLHKVAPYDSADLNNMEQTERSYEGTRSTSESYSGSPDTASSKTTTTGTDTEETTSDISGNIGTTTSQMMLESHLNLSQRMKLAEEIEHDIAKELLLQLWI